MNNQRYNSNNESAPAIYVKSGDKVFITSTSSTNTMSVSGLFEADGETNLDAVIYSKSDLVFNGTGSLEIISTRANGITSKDDLKITGGVYAITAADDAIEANDSIRIYGGTINIETCAEGIEGTTIQINDGTINIVMASADKDGFDANGDIIINGGTVIINGETVTELPASQMGGKSCK